MNKDRLTREQRDKLETLSFLWEGKVAWQVYRTHWHTTAVVIQFENREKPSLRELIAMRCLVREFNWFPPAQLRAAVGQKGTYDFGELGGLEGRYLANRAEELGLNVLITKRFGIDECLIKPDSMDQIDIPDETVRSAVV